MADARKLLREIVGDMVGSVILGRSKGVVAKRLKDKSGLALTLEELEPPSLSKPPAHLLVAARQAHPSDVKEMIKLGGRRLRGDFEDLAQRFNAIKRGMAARTLAKAIGDKTAPTMAARIAGRGAGRQAFLKWLDLDQANARALFEQAVSSLKDGALEEKVRQLLKRIPLQGDMETYASRLAKELPKADRERFTAAIHEQVCVEIVDQLRRELPGAMEEPLIAQALQAAKQQRPAEFAPLFRKRLRTLFSGTAAGDELARIVAGLDGTAQAKFVDGFFGAVGERPVKLLLDAHFDADGRRRLLMAFASFRKSYSFTRMKKAMESLIGWMYEASTFVAELTRTATIEFQQSLTKALKSANSGLTVGEPLVHFDLMAPGLTGVSNQQATDLLGSVPLTRGSRTVHVVASALESKGEYGVEAGVDQLVNLPKRLAPGAVVRSEHGVFTVGKDLFLSVDEALLALGESAATRKAVASGVQRSYAAIVVSPLPEAAVMAKYGALFKGRIRYAGHPVSRVTMEKAAEALAPHFQLLVTQ